MGNFHLSLYNHKFPPIDIVYDDGLLAIYGDLSLERLIAAYKNGIFPWYNENDPILWWCPDPRFALFPQNVHVSESMRKILRREIFTIKIDDDFKTIMTKCGELREQKGTWIIPEMIDAYTNLFNNGYAHCISVYHNDELVGGLYGVNIGKIFCGESMFSTMSNASKVAFIVMARLMVEHGIEVVDCQFETNHLFSLGGQNISREQYLDILKGNIEIKPNFTWKDWLQNRTTKDFV